jgi:hypothetical protein
MNGELVPLPAQVSWLGHERYQAVLHLKNVIKIITYPK